MARRQYPSDLARLRVRPHVKVHLTTRSHHRTAEAWADPEMRGMIVGLWQLAAEAFAGKTGDTVTLNRSDIAWISGRHRRDVALTSLQRLANVMGYSLRLRGDVAEITIRNFAKKQGFDSATSVATPRTTPTSDSDSDSDSEEEKKESARGLAPPPPAAPLALVPDPPPRAKSREPRGLTEPPERLSDADRSALASWARSAATRGSIPALSPDDLLRAEAITLDWARSNGKRKRDWQATIRNAIREGWALRRAPSATTSSGPDRAYHRPFEPFVPPPPPTEAELAELERARADFARKRGRG